jgi:tRNA A-37 threonylcarbamoyl transferase component Bud32
MLLHLALLVTLGAFCIAAACTAERPLSQPSAAVFRTDANATSSAHATGVFYVSYPTSVVEFQYGSGTSNVLAGTSNASTRIDGSARQATFMDIRAVHFVDSLNVMFIIDGTWLRRLTLSTRVVETLIRDQPYFASAVLTDNSTHLFIGGTSACVFAIPLAVVGGPAPLSDAVVTQLAPLLGTCGIVSTSLRSSEIITNLHAALGEVLQIVYSPPSMFLFVRTQHDSRWLVFIHSVGWIAPGAFYTQSVPKGAIVYLGETAIAGPVCSVEYVSINKAEMTLLSTTPDSPAPSICTQSRSAIGITTTKENDLLVLLQTDTRAARPVEVVLLSRCTIGFAASLAPQALPPLLEDTATLAPETGGKSTVGPLVVGFIAAGCVLLVLASVAGAVIATRVSRGEDPDDAKKKRTRAMTLISVQSSDTALSQTQNVDEQAANSLACIRTTDENTRVPSSANSTIDPNCVQVAFLDADDDFARSLTRHERRTVMVAQGSYTRGKLLGRGANGAVYSALLKDGSTIAMKEVSLAGTADEMAAQVEAVKGEARVLQILRHPNIVIYYGTSFDEKNFKVRLFMECVTGGSLGAMVRSMTEPLDDNLARIFVRQITKGLAYMHSNHFIHRDLKCDNILRDEASGTLKLADFGTARVVSAVTTLADNGAKTLIGTPLFMAPEVCGAFDSMRSPSDSGSSDAGYGPKADIWSLGITVVELINCGRPPWPDFPSAGHAFVYIAGGGAPRLPTRMTDLCRSFVTMCLGRDPKHRPTAAELLSHPWIADVK